MGLGSSAEETKGEETTEEEIEEKDDEFKYKATQDGKYEQLQAALVGTCIATSELTGTVKSRRGASDNLAGITHDGANMYEYLFANGAEIALLQFQVPAPDGVEIKLKIRDFLMKPGGNKLLYITGHGDRDGDLLVGEGAYLRPRDCMIWLSEANFAGNITFVVDACYAGMWAEKISEIIFKVPCDKKCFKPLKEAAQRRRENTCINLRLSCLPWETSDDTSKGGVYTWYAISQLRKEWKHTSLDGAGWGTKVFAQKKPTDVGCVFGISTDEPQTDLVVDFTIRPNGTSKMYFPSTREDYLKRAREYAGAS